jgi:glycosyltransferase involved in cell wall biosynthesis
MPLYNKADYVLETIKSVLAQTLNDWELIVVDDGSTDGGAALVQSLGDPRIRVVSQTNEGVSAARNKGVELARVDLIAFLDADDLWAPQFLSTILALQADFPDAHWFATSYEIRPLAGRGYVSRLNGLGENFSRGIISDYFKVAIISDPPVCSIQSIGGFPVGIASGEDLLTWARLAVHFKLAYEARPLSVFVVSGIERQPLEADKVGDILENLLSEYPTIPGLRAYLGMWYRMQAVMAIRFGFDNLARKRAFLAILYGPGQVRNLYTLFLVFLPRVWRRTVDIRVRILLSKKKGNAKS